MSIPSAALVSLTVLLSGCSAFDYCRPLSGEGVCHSYFGTTVDTGFKGTWNPQAAAQGLRAAGYEVDSSDDLVFAHANRSKAWIRPAFGGSLEASPQAWVLEITYNATTNYLRDLSKSDANREASLLRSQVEPEFNRTLAAFENETEWRHVDGPSWHAAQAK